MGDIFIWRHQLSYLYRSKLSFTPQGKATAYEQLKFMRILVVVSVLQKIANNEIALIFLIMFAIDNWKSVVSIDCNGLIIFIGSAQDSGLRSRFGEGRGEGGLL